MPLGNIDPRNDVLTLTSMKLGNEEYPSTVQQAESENTGYLLYSPKLCHFNHGGTAATSSAAGTTKTTIGNIYLNSGNYDFEVKFTADVGAAGAGAVWLEVGGVHVSSDHGVSAGTTIIESFAGATLSAGWSAVQAVAYNDCEIYEVDSYMKQYG